ncbi:ABC transporter permease [Azospirillum thermophilum]|uniref:ABC transporter permease n=1 Tax=Azospirillum thermophilum TaxID=2202148 RepID=A0A2S2CY54_9PROT|nr:ABC transporter permease subunit [Azospirillum thermophilum]AWK89345.1 ABC transporter permease [Azospirillum thermophilum]
MPAILVKSAQRGLSLLLLLAVWQVAASAAASRLLPAPPEVLEAVLRGVASGELPFHLAMTLGRVAASFAVSMLIGAAIGIALGRLALLDRLFDGWLVLFLNLPALVVIILCYVWFGMGEAAAVLAVSINKIPNVAVILREGARALDRDFLDVAQVYRLGPLRTARHVVLPQLAPYFLAAARSGLALIWKIVLVVELLGRSNGVGFQINLYFQLFDVTAILAYTFVFIALVMAIEAAVLQPLDRRLARWRR